ncbi:MAG: M24 family metallopeptidase [Ignavibacteriales bacterium]|nr:M24 family metallopeptidase [Ignavibacteriales bacterium]
MKADTPQTPPETFLAGGFKAKADSKQKEIYTKVLKAFLNGLNFDLKENSTGFDIDYKVREIVNNELEEGFKFNHGTGHGIGISTHEALPRISPARSV